MSTLYAIDPGPSESALVLLKGSHIAAVRIRENKYINTFLRERSPRQIGDTLVIEQIECFGMPVGEEVFTTVWWSGRFAETWLREVPDFARFAMVSRRTVKLTLCGTSRAKDPHVRQRLIDLYGGPACVKKGGALAGIKTHLWSALALAVAYQQMINKPPSADAVDPVVSNSLEPSTREKGSL